MYEVHNNHFGYIFHALVYDHGIIFHRRMQDYVGLKKKMMTNFFLISVILSYKPMF